VSFHRTVRLASLVVFAVACGLAYHRFHRTPEQVDLARYVESELPKIFSSEAPIEERVDRLGRAPGLSSDAARALLVDDLVPRLLRLRRQVEELHTDTSETRALNAEYLGITDRLIDACRACVRVIDDPKLPQAAGLSEVRARFAEVRRAYRSWDDHVRAACARHRLAGPVAR
jgi:hypothetical protein